MAYFTPETVQLKSVEGYSDVEMLLSGWITRPVDFTLLPGEVECFALMYASHVALEAFPNLLLCFS